METDWSETNAKELMACSSKVKWSKTKAAISFGM
jgi:hypothetical protein